jgi:5-methylthioadenosine/S-adenosylhomocysteine deaminase
LSDCLIRGGFLFDTHRPFEAADILVRDGVIVKISPHIAPPDGMPVVEARGRFVVPGLVNAHTHSNQTFEKGLCDRFPLDAWKVMASYGGANAELRPRDLYVSASINAIEMLRTGTTATVDMPNIDLRWFEEGSDAIMQAYADIGLRASVAVSLTDLDFATSMPFELVPGALEQFPPGRTGPSREMIDHAGQFIRRWKGRHPLLTPMVGPSSLNGCSNELFEAAVDLARTCGVGLQTHLLSGKSQVFVGHRRYGGSTLGYLQRLHCLEDWASFAHAIWLDDEEIAIFGESSAVAVHNPGSNLKLGVGRAPVPALFKAGARVALGSDGAASAGSQNMFETIKATALLHRIAHEQDEWVLAQDALEMCWDGGAAAVRQPIGRIEVGYRADLVLLDDRTLFTMPKAQMAEQIVYGEGGGSVETVLVGGKIVLNNRRITGIDEASLRQEAQEIVSRIYEGLPDRMRKFEPLRPLMQELERVVNKTDLNFTRYCH